MVKNLIDPDKLDLLSPPTDKSEFVQQLHHNYLVVYDNVIHTHKEDDTGKKRGGFSLEMG